MEPCREGLKTEKYCYDKFCERRSQFKSVHDRNLQKWAMHKTHELNVQVKASRRWVSNFKRRYKIVDRKITKFVTSRYSSNQQDILESANKFREEMKKKCANYDDDCIWNVDETGIQKEMRTGRTLWFRNEKKVLALTVHYGAPSVKASLCQYNATYIGIIRTICS